MHIITRRRLLKFAKKHPDCSTALESWYRIVKRTDFNSFNELRQTFPSADIVDNLTVFNIGGNKARLIAAIHYNPTTLLNLIFYNFPQSLSSM